MTHLHMMYFALIPFQVAILGVKLAGYAISPAFQALLFYYSVNILNWICGYHWSLSMQSLQNQTKISCSLLIFLSLWATYTYAEGQTDIAAYMMIFLTGFQSYGDFRSDITYAISPNIKFARIIMSLSMIICLFWAI